LHVVTITSARLDMNFSIHWYLRWWVNNIK